MVITKDVKVGVIWAGVVADYADLLNNWRRRSAGGSPTPGATPSASGRRWRDVFQAEFGSPELNRAFWDSISANAYVNDISGPVQIHHAKGDASVPWEFSQSLADDLEAAGQEHELYIYDGDDHNLTANFGTAMRRTVEYFDRYLKDS
jgi:dipeptidyl aminopeptidase/acylaminoacyl peptidase